MTWSTPKTWAVGDPATASDLNAYIRDNTAYLYGDTAWTSPTLTNGWAGAAGYRKSGTRVALEGNINSGTINTAAFTLPAGYAPTAYRQFAIVSNGSFGVVSVTTGGVVTPVIGSNVGVALDGISFDTI